MAFFNVTPVEKIDTLTETFGNGMNTSVREEEAKPDMFDGALGALGDGVVSGFNRSKYNLYGTDTDEGLNRRREIAESVRKMQPDPKTMGSAAQLMFGIAEPLSFIGTQFMQDPITSIVAPSTLAMSVTKDFEPVQTELNKAQGMDAATATDVARTQSVAMGVGTILPTSVTGNLFTRFLTGGALNVAVGAGERAETGRLLRAAGYADMAKQYSALDGNAAAAEFILGGVFGGAFGNRARVRANPDAVLPSNIDAALAVNQSVNANVDLAPGVPLNGKSAQAHTEALNTAIEQLAFGEKVNVENLLTEADFLGKRQDFDAVGIIRQELEKAGFNDVAAKVRDLESAAKERGLYVDPADLNVVLSDAPATIKVGGSRGRESEVKIGNDYVPVEYRLMEVDDVRGTMDKADNQYRDRTRVASERQISEAAANLDPRLLGESWTLDSGAPVMTADGKIIAGNGRAAFIERAYSTNAGESYRSYLRDEAEALGLNASQIDGMTNPVLVRVLKKDVDVQKAAILSNEGGAMGMSALEQAKVDGERLGDFTAFQFNEDGSVSNVANMPFIRQWAGKFPTNQQSRLMDSDGMLSAEGSRRLQNAVMYRAYGDSDTLTRLVEATDPGSRNIVAALSRTAARVADAKERIARGELYPLDLSDDLLNAVEKIDSLKRSGMSVGTWVNQLDAFGDGMSGEARALVVMMDRNIRSARAIGDAIDGYYSRLAELGDPKQGSIFEAATPTKQDVFAPMLDVAEVMYSRSSVTPEAVESFASSVKDELGLKQFSLYMSNGSLKLNVLIVPKELQKQGVGTKAMERLTEFADANGLRVTLTAAIRDDFHGTTSHSRLVKFYKRFGFVENKGRKKDFSVSDGMIREPRSEMYSRSQTQTPEFKAWFGESKVTDESGNPRVMYHGTAVTDISTFQGNRLSAGHFAFEPAFASHFADTRYADAIDNGMDIEYGDGAVVYPAYLSAKNIFDPRKKEHRDAVGKEVADDYTSLEENLPAIKDAGFDAYYDFEGGGEPTGIAVFNPEQIKSAIGNSGAFDPANPSILYGRGGTRSTVSDLTATFKAQFGKDAGKLMEAGRVSIVQSVTDLPARNDATPHPADVGGMYDPRTGITYIVADNTAPSQIRGRILHEIGVHSGIETMLGQDLYASVLAQVDARIQNGDARFIEARRLAEANAARPEHIPQETLAYLVENAPESSLGRRILAAVRQWIYRTTGGRFVDLNVNDLVSMASASLRRQTRIDGVAVAADDAPYYSDNEYRGAHRAPMRDSGAPLHDVTGGGNIYPDDVYSKYAVEYYGTGEDAMDKASFAIVKQMRGKPDAPVKIYRAVPKDAPDVINQGDWITINKRYAAEHGDYALDGNYKIIETTVTARDIYTNGDSIHEWGYDPADAPQYSRAREVDDFYRNAGNSDTISTNDNPLITTMIPTGDIMEPIGLATAKADAEIQTAVAMEPGFISAIECALVAGE